MEQVILFFMQEHVLEFLPPPVQPQELLTNCFVRFPIWQQCDRGSEIWLYVPLNLIRSPA